MGIPVSFIRIEGLADVTELIAKEEIYVKKHLRAGIERGKWTCI